jgi:hypothetical protein
MTNPSTRADGRRRRSAKARNRGRRIGGGAAGYGKLGTRGVVTMVVLGWSNWIDLEVAEVRERGLARALERPIP